MKVSLPNVIVRARRRLLRNGLAVVSVRAACAGVGSLVLLLLLGTDLVDWRWLLALPLFLLAAGALLVCRRRPTPYRTAQLLDARLHLADTLSTAVFYWPRNSWAKCNEVMRCRQRECAMRAAAGVNLRSALPLRIPRPVVSCLTVLAVLAVGLSILRYRSEGRLDLRGPALPGIQQWVRNVASQLAGIDRYRRIPEPDRGARAGREEDAALQENSGPDSSEARPTTDGDAVPRTDELAEKSKKPATGAGNQTTGKQTADRQQQEADDATDSREEGSARPGDTQSSGRNTAQPGTSAGLLGKLSNSLSNLSSALKSKLARAQQTQAAQDGHSDKGRGNASAEGSGRDTPGSRGTPEAGTRAAGAAGDSSQSDAGRDGASGRPANPDRRGASGAGSDDGKKEIQQAKQLEAMGKISVILGKRSQTVSGTASVEVNSGRSQLTTPYQARQAAHGAVTSAERDRIPIEFETYVQQYFRQLRKYPGRRAK